LIDVRRRQVGLEEPLHVRGITEEGLFVGH
jgi:hypothetical protein